VGANYIAFSDHIYSLLPSVIFTSSTAFYKHKKATGKRINRRSFRELFEVRETLTGKKVTRGKGGGTQ